MSEFHCEHWIKAVKKPHKCEQCGTLIQIGDPATKTAGVCCGDFYYMYQHVECNAAGQAYATLTNYWGEEFTWFQHDHDKDIDEWLLEYHPIVAARLGVERNDS